MSSGPRHVYEVYIRTTPQRLWEALTSPEVSQRYFYGTAVTSTFAVGAPIRWLEPDGTAALEGVVLESEPPARLVHSFVMLHHAEARLDRPSRVTWEIDGLGETCKLTLVHDEFESETATWREVAHGWNPVLSGLKTLLETGRPLDLKR
jgi:uncharacterized protein YndB with AHSA1/START domain